MKDIQETVQEYTKKCPSWCPLALLIGGAVIFILGLILGAPLIKALWLLLGLLVLAAGGAAYYFGSKKATPAPKAPVKPEEPKE